MNEPMGRLGFLQTCARPANRVRDGLDRAVLAYHALVQPRLHVAELGLLALQHFLHGNAGPFRHHGGDVVLGDFLAQKRTVLLRDGEFFILGLEFLLQLGQTTEANLSGASEIALPLQKLRLGLGLLDFALEFLQIGDYLLFALPGQLHAVDPLAQFRDLGLDLSQAVDGRLVALLGQRRLLHQAAGQAALQLIDGFGQRFQLHLQAAGCFVDQIDGLVGKLSPGNIAVREARRRHQGIVADTDAVVDLVALFQAAQNRHGVVYRRLAHEYRLEPAFQRLVLLDALAVLVERGGADAAQIAARQGRLEHVGRVDRALGRARADQGVQLVDEQDDLALGRRDLLEHGLEPILEFAAELGARNQRAEIERQDALALERFWNVTGGNPLRDPFHDGGLAHARLADDDRVVLGAAA